MKTKKKTAGKTASAKSAPIPSEALAIARTVLTEASSALAATADRLDAGFARAVAIIAECRGRLVVSGIGKTGFVAQKISATFASTGTPSLFLHPTDALHGDLGRITASDVLLALSYSGETEEMLRLIGPVKRVGARVLAITAESSSTLAREADLNLEMGRHREAGNGFAPTTSTAVMMSLGDALAMAVLEIRGFTEDQFHLYHPGGSLGRKRMRVGEVMRKGEMVPIVSRATPLRNVIAVMTKTPGRPGAATIVDRRGLLIGMFTDGDLRRLLEGGDEDLDRAVHEVMCSKPKTVTPDWTVKDAAQLLREHRVDQVPVVDERGRPIGLLDVQDLLAMRFL
jgi:arabinose-5-phosphate isomerase